MMKKGKGIFLYIFILLAGCSPDDSIPPDEVFIKYFGGSEIDQAADLLVNEENGVVNGFVVLGTSNSPQVLGEIHPDSTTQFAVFFTGTDGNQLPGGVVAPLSNLREEYSDIPPVYHAKASRIKKTSDGGYIVTGTITYDVTIDETKYTQSDILVVKMDAQGGALAFWKSDWFTFQSGGASVASNETAGDVTEVSDGYIIVGSTNQVKTPGAGNGSDFYVMKLDMQLAPAWPVPLVEGKAFNDIAVSAESIFSGSAVMIAGTTRESSGADASGDVWMMQVQSNGTAAPSAFPNEIFGVQGLDETVVRMRSVSDNDFYVAGNTNSGGTARPFLMRITGFTQQFNQRIEVSNGVLVQDVTRSLSGRYLFAGTTDATVDGGVLGSQLLLMRTDAFGGVDTEFGGASNESSYSGVRYGGGVDETGQAVAQLPDGSILLLGTVAVDNNANTMIVLMKTNRNGVLGK